MIFRVENILTAVQRTYKQEHTAYMQTHANAYIHTYTRRYRGSIEMGRVYVRGTGGTQRGAKDHSTLSVPSRTERPLPSKHK